MKKYKKWFDFPLYFHVLIALFAMLNLSVANSLGEVKELAAELSSYQELINENIDNLETKEPRSYHELSDTISVNFTDNQVVLVVTETEYVIASDPNMSVDEFNLEISGIIMQVLVVSLLSKVIFKYLFILFAGIALITVTTMMFKFKHKFTLLIKHYTLALVVSQLTLAFYFIEGISNAFLLFLHIAVASILFTLSLKQTINNSLSTYYLGGEEGI